MAAKVKYDSVKVGDEIPKYVVEGVTRPDFVRYAGASGDFVPLHYDQTFVEAAGIPTVFAQGMFTAGLLSRAVTDYVGVGNVRRFQVRFATRVWPGDVVTCTGKITNKVEKDGEKQIEGDLIVSYSFKQHNNFDRARLGWKPSAAWQVGVESVLLKGDDYRVRQNGVFAGTSLDNGLSLSVSVGRSSPRDESRSTYFGIGIAKSL